MRAGAQGNAHGDGADIQMLAVDHVQRFFDLVLIQHNSFPLPLVACGGSDAVHGVEHVGALNGDDLAQRLAHLIEFDRHLAESGAA